MLTTEPTFEMIQEWKRVFAAEQQSLSPNRKTGAEVDAYFRAHYPLFEVFDSAEWREMVTEEILLSPPHAEKLPPGNMPEIAVYRMGDVYAAIDLVTGHFHIECEDIGRIVPIFDDLFLYRGLDKADLQNYFLVAEYVRLLAQITSYPHS